MRKNSSQVSNGLRPTIHIVDDLDFLKLLSEKELKSMWEELLTFENKFKLPIILGIKGEVKK